MRNSAVNILVANFFLGLSLFFEGFLGIILIFLGSVWFITYIIISKAESKSLELKFELERAERNLEAARFKTLLLSINRLIEVQKKKKR